MLRNYYTVALRNLLRYRSVTLINIISLAFGIACCIVLFLIVRYESSFDNYHEKADRIYRVNQHTRYQEGEYGGGNTAHPVAEALRQDFPQLQKVTQGYFVNEVIVTVEHDNEVDRFKEERVLYADSEFTEIFDYEWIAGSREHALDGPAEAVLTRPLAIRYFGHTDVVGKRIRIDDRDISVAGLIESLPGNTNNSFTILLSYQLLLDKYNENFQQNWGMIANGVAYVVLPESMKATAFNNELRHWADKYNDPSATKEYFFSVTPLTELHTTGTLKMNYQYIIPEKALIGFTFLAGLILFAACINYINLTTARAMARSREIGVRKVMGGSRSQLFFQFLSETFLVTLVALLLGLFLAEMALGQLNKALEIINFDVVMTWEVIYFSMAVLLLITLLAGSYPSLVLSGFRPVRALSMRHFSSRSGLWLRRALVVSQFAITQLLIAGTLVAAGQMYFIENTDLGFEQNGVIEIPLAGNSVPQLTRLEDGWAELAAVDNITFAQNAPLNVTGSNWSIDLTPLNAPVSHEITSQMKFADEKYIDFFDLDLIAGRPIRPGMDTIVTEILINRTLVEELGYHSSQGAIGRSVRFWDRDYEIVGVLQDFHNNSLREEIGPMVLIHDPGMFYTAEVRLTGEVEDHIGAIRDVWEEVYPDSYFQYGLLSDHIAQGYVKEYIFYSAFKVISLLSIIIGCMGLYGLVSFMSLSKTKEIGIRKVLGAHSLAILLAFGKEFLILVTISFFLALPLVYLGMGEWLSQFAYRISISPVYFIVGFILSLLLMVMTVGYNSYRSSQINPVEALRDE